MIVYKILQANKKQLHQNIYYVVNDPPPCFQCKHFVVKGNQCKKFITSYGEFQHASLSRENILQCGFQGRFFERKNW